MLALQKRLEQLGYWLSTPDGAYGSLTQQAVWAFQKSAGLKRDGVVGPKTLRALEAGIRPKATLSGDGVEIDLDRQILLVVRGGSVRTILNTSTGSGEEYTSTSGNRALAKTPRGSFTVYRAVDGTVTNTLGGAVAAAVLQPGHRGARLAEHPAVARLARLRPAQQRRHRHGLGGRPDAGRQPRARPLSVPRPPAATNPDRTYSAVGAMSGRPIGHTRPMTAAADAPDAARKADGSPARGRHAQARRRRRWPWLVVAGMVLVAVVATIGVVVLRDRAEATSAEGCTGAATLRIAAAPALSSTLEEFADDFDTWVKDRAGVPCTTTQITAASPQGSSPSRWAAPSTGMQRRHRRHGYPSPRCGAACWPVTLGSARAAPHLPGDRRHAGRVRRPAPDGPRLSAGPRCSPRGSSSVHWPPTRPAGPPSSTPSGARFGSTGRTR